MKNKKVLIILIVIVLIIVGVIVFLLKEKTPGIVPVEEPVSSTEGEPRLDKDFSQEQKLSQKEKQVLAIEPIMEANLKILSTEEKEKIGIGPETKTVRIALSAKEKETLGISQDREVVVRSLSTREKEKLGLDPNLVTIVKLTLSENKLLKEESITRLLEKLKKNHPEFSTSQLEFYKDTAIKGSLIESCDDRADRDDCYSAVAFLTERYDICNEAAEGKEVSEKNIKAKIDCSNSILTPEKTAAEIDKCNSFDNSDFKVECFISIFQMYEQPENCSGFETTETRKMCEGVLYYQRAMMQGDKKLCAKIEDNYLKIYCSNLVI